VKKIYLSPSEQPENTYAYGNTNEKAVCCEISAYLEKALKRHGFEVMTGTSKSLGTRCSEANKWGADLYIPVHTNAYNGKVSGTRMFCYQLNGEGYNACKAIYNVLAPITPGKSENVTAYPGLYEVKTPKAPTVYIEVDFHDVPDVAKWIIEHTKEIGEAICKGVCNHYGVAYKAEEAPKKETGKLYRVQVGAYSEKANAEAMLAKLKKAGFEGFIKEG
jgi:N-acetylmuramoyl-L-alanine amidase